MKNKLTCDTTLKQSDYGPHNKDWKFDSTDVLHEMGHVFHFQVRNGTIVEIPVFYLFQFAKFFEQFPTGGKAMEFLYSYKGEMLK